MFSYIFCVGIFMVNGRKPLEYLSGQENETRAYIDLKSIGEKIPPLAWHHVRCGQRMQRDARDEQCHGRSG